MGRAHDSSEVSGSGGSTARRPPAACDAGLRRGPASSSRAASVDGRRARVAATLSLERLSARVVAGHPGAGRPHDPGERGARDQDQPGREQEHREDVGADRRDQVRGHPKLRLPQDPAARLERRRRPVTGARHRPGPTPSVPAASASVIEQRSGRSRPVRIGRAGRPQFAHEHERRRRPRARPARRTQRAEHEPHRRRPRRSRACPRSSRRRRPPPSRIPTAISPSAEDVDVVRLELDVRQPQRWPASQQRARRALGRRLLSLAGGHFGGTGFDASAPLPPVNPYARTLHTAVPSAYRMAEFDAHPVCWSSRTTTRSRRSSSARCGWRGTRCGSPATAQRAR